MMTTNRQKQIETATKLQQVLGEGYEVRYDRCESCLTDFFYMGHLYKTVRNDELTPSLNVGDFEAPTELKMQIMYGLI